MDDTNTAVVDSSPAPAAPDSATTTPETSAPATPPARPTSMRDAFAKVAESRAAKGTAAATAPPAPAGDLPTPPAKTPGPIPFDVHKTALDNARAKAVEEVAGQWKDYEWVRQVPAADLREFTQMVIEAKGDPLAVLSKLADQIAADPVHGPQLRSLAAKQLAAGRGQGQPVADEEPTPDVEIVNQDGQVTGVTYSAPQQAKREAWLKRQFMAEVGDLLAPLQQSHEKAVAAEQTATAKAAAADWSGNFSQEITQYRGFAEHKQDIGRDVLAQLQQLDPTDPRGNDPAWLEAATLRAYHRVVGPKLPALIQAQHAASLKQKAIAQTESPSGMAPAITTRPRNPKELAKLLEQKAAQRGR